MTDFTRKHGTHQDYSGQELRNFSLEKLDSHPVIAFRGRSYYNTVDECPYFHDGTNWIKLRQAKGGWYSVDNIDQRDSIPVSLREFGMSITYKHEGLLVTAVFNSSDTGDVSWTNPSNWKMIQYDTVQMVNLTASNEAELIAALYMISTRRNQGYGKGGEIIFTSSITLTNLWDSVENNNGVYDAGGVKVNLNGYTLYQSGKTLKLQGQSIYFYNGTLCGNNIAYSDVNYDHIEGIHLLSDADDVGSGSTLLFNVKFDQVIFLNYIGVQVTATSVVGSNTLTNITDISLIEVNDYLLLSTFDGWCKVLSRDAVNNSAVLDKTCTGKSLPVMKADVTTGSDILTNVVNSFAFNNGDTLLVDGFPGEVTVVSKIDDNTVQVSAQALTTIESSIFRLKKTYNVTSISSNRVYAGKHNIRGAISTSNSNAGTIGFNLCYFMSWTGHESGGYEPSIDVCPFTIDSPGSITVYNHFNGVHQSGIYSSYLRVGLKTSIKHDASLSFFVDPNQTRKNADGSDGVFVDNPLYRIFNSNKIAAFNTRFNAQVESYMEETSTDVGGRYILITGNDGIPRKLQLSKIMPSTADHVTVFVDSTSVTVEHGLSKRPHVTVYLLDGREVEGEVLLDVDNPLDKLVFNSNISISGYLRCS
jgi:hypothetical protein